MNLPTLAPYASHDRYANDYAATIIAAVRTGVRLSGKGGGGGPPPPPPQPPASGICARSCIDCSNAGYRSCGYNQWCANRYPAGPYTSGLPYGCG